MAKKISYYDLLDMVKNNKYPNVYYIEGNNKVLYGPEFDIDGSISCYKIADKNLQNEDCRYFLTENFLECSIFDEILEIKEEIEKANYQTSLIPPWFKDKKIIKVVNENFELHTKAINKIFDEIKEIKENQDANR